MSHTALESLSQPGPKPGRIYLSVPHMSGLEQDYIRDAFAGNWIAASGPHVEAFEREFSKVVGASHTLAVNSGTAAIHLAMRLAGVERGDEVLVSTLTFTASANPAVYQGAIPCFVDSDRASWNMDPQLLAETLHERARRGKLPKAAVVVHLYGQSADMDAILAACRRYDVSVIEDAAESLGASYRGATPGTLGRAGIFSFAGNKVITTGGGGMLVSNDETLIAHARKLAHQAREPVVHYEHREIGYNYRLSNILAAIGRAQLKVLDQRVAARRRNFDFYSAALADLPGLEFMPEAPWGTHARWLTCLTVDDRAFGMDREQLRLILDAADIEARPVWKPMHLQPVFADCPRVAGSVAEDLFTRGLCLPSSSSLTEADLQRVADVIRSAQRRGRPQ